MADTRQEAIVSPLKLFLVDEKETQDDVPESKQCDPLVIKELQRESEKLSEQVAELQTKLKELMGKPDVPFRQPIFTDDKPTAVPSEGSRKDDTQNKRFSFAQFCKADINAHSIPRLATSDGSVSFSYLMIATPFHVEWLQAFGLLICLDDILFLFTILPLRILWALLQVCTSVLCLGFRRQQIRRVHLHDIMRGLLLFGGSFCMVWLCRLSTLYHYIRTQEVIKLYVIYNMMEILDKMCSMLGEEATERFNLSVRATEADDAHRKCPRLNKMWLFNFIALLVYIVVHSSLKFVKVVTLNVAMSSKATAMLTLLISTGFVEIRRAVFRRYLEGNVFQIVLSDIVERFELSLLLFCVLVLNSEIHTLWPLNIWNAKSLTPFHAKTLVILCTEMMVDWLKHSFISKVNGSGTSSYPKFAAVLANDVLAYRRPITGSSNSAPVGRRLGLSPFCLAVLTIRVAVWKVGSLTLENQVSWHSVTWVLASLMIFLCMLMFKVMLSLLVAYLSSRLVNVADKPVTPGVKRKSESVASAKPKTATLASCRTPMKELMKIHRYILHGKNVM